MWIVKKLFSSECIGICLKYKMQLICSYFHLISLSILFIYIDQFQIDIQPKRRVLGYGFLIIYYFI